MSGEINNKKHAMNLWKYWNREIVENTPERKTICKIANKENAKLICNYHNCHAELVEALRCWKSFFDDMPKGQLGKISCDVGLMNDAFIKMGKVLAKVKSMEEAQ